MVCETNSVERLESQLPERKVEIHRYQVSASDFVDKMRELWRACEDRTFPEQISKTGLDELCGEPGAQRTALKQNG